MIEDKITALLDQEEKLLASAVARTMQAYNQNPTVANLRDYEAAKKALEAFRQRKAAMDNPDAQSFKNLLEVLDYLQAEGWKISKSTLYDKAFAIKKQPDGTYLKKDIDDFATRYLRKLDGSDTQDIDISKKIEAEIRKLTAEAEKKELEIQRLKGSLVDRQEVEQQLADRAAYLKTSLIEFFHSMAPKLVELCEGNNARIPDIVEFCIKELETHMDHYSRPMVFNVIANTYEGEYYED